MNDNGYFTVDISYILRLVPNQIHSVHSTTTSVSSRNSNVEANTFEQKMNLLSILAFFVLISVIFCGKCKELIPPTKTELKENYKYSIGDGMSTHCWISCFYNELMVYYLFWMHFQTSSHVRKYWSQTQTAKNSHST